ncbi:MAG: hypothetical protein ABR909_03965 [Candidatus Bathyarchaeia archaeon]
MALPQPPRSLLHTTLNITSTANLIIQYVFSDHILCIQTLATETSLEMI